MGLMQALILILSLLSICYGTLRVDCSEPDHSNALLGRRWLGGNAGNPDYSRCHSNRFASVFRLYAGRMLSGSLGWNRCYLVVVVLVMVLR
jgi:hypothetical protein